MKKPESPLPEKLPEIIADGKFDTLVSINLICQLLNMQMRELNFVIRTFAPHIKVKQSQGVAPTWRPESNLFISSYVLKDFIQHIPTQNLNPEQRLLIPPLSMHIQALVEDIRWKTLPQHYAEQGILAEREKEAYEKITWGAIQLYSKALKARRDKTLPFNRFSIKNLSSAPTKSLKKILEQISNDLSHQEIQDLSSPGRNAAICSWLELTKKGRPIIKSHSFLFITECKIDVYEETPKEFRQKIYDEDAPEPS